MSAAAMLSHAADVLAERSKTYGDWPNQEDQKNVPANGSLRGEHVIKGKGNEIGFGAITEIKLYEGKGLQYVGPLPAEVQNYTSYDAAMMTGGTAATEDFAREVLKHMATPASKAIFVKAGVE